MLNASITVPITRPTVWWVVLIKSCLLATRWGADMHQPQCLTEGLDSLRGGWYLSEVVYWQRGEVLTCINQFVYRGTKPSAWWVVALVLYRGPGLSAWWVVLIRSKLFTGYAVRCWNASTTVSNSNRGPGPSVWSTVLISSCLLAKRWWLHQPLCLQTVGTPYVIDGTRYSHSVVAYWLWGAEMHQPWCLPRPNTLCTTNGTDLWGADMNQPWCLPRPNILCTANGTYLWGADMHQPWCLPRPNILCTTNGTYLWGADMHQPWCLPRP